jgi:hypothetical protein
MLMQKNALIVTSALRFAPQSFAITALVSMWMSMPIYVSAAAPVSRRVAMRRAAVSMILVPLCRLLKKDNP